MFWDKWPPLVLYRLDYRQITVFIHFQQIIGRKKKRFVEWSDGWNRG